VGQVPDLPNQICSTSDVEQAAGRQCLLSAGIRLLRDKTTLACFRFRVYTSVFVAQPMEFREEIDPMAPQREAALFYGLFLRGHSAETLRRDIDVPKKLLDKMLKRHRNELGVREKLQRGYQFRKQVLAVFDELITRERTRERIQ
jgi:hypothetical protein